MPFLDETGLAHFWNQIIARLNGRMASNNPVGTGSFSMNRKADTPIGPNSSTFGVDCTASAALSFAEGQDTVASGTLSHAEGFSTIAAGDVAHAEGMNTRATGEAAHTEGKHTEAAGNYSHAEGYDTIAAGVCAHAEGYESKAIKDYAHAEGYHTEAKALYAHTEGYGTSAYGEASHAEGNQTEARGNCSHAEGGKALASGDYSHAEGVHLIDENGETVRVTVASGMGAHAEGGGTTASGDVSHAEGLNTIAASQCQHVQGCHNIPDPYSQYLHIVGNGSGSEYDDERSNAHTIDWQGNAWFAGDVYVGSTHRVNKDEGSKKLLSTGDVITVANGGTGCASLADTTYTTARYRGSSLHNADTAPTVEGAIAWQYE
jgi:hypothetical protein